MFILFLAVNRLPFFGSTNDRQATVNSPIWPAKVGRQLQIWGLFSIYAAQRREQFIKLNFKDYICSPIQYL
jgi:hypothetical protein